MDSRLRVTQMMNWDNGYLQTTHLLYLLSLRQWCFWEDLRMAAIYRDRWTHLQEKERQRYKDWHFYCVVWSYNVKPRIPPVHGMLICCGEWNTECVWRKRAAKGWWGLCSRESISLQRLKEWMPEDCWQAVPWQSLLKVGFIGSRPTLKGPSWLRLGLDVCGDRLQMCVGSSQLHMDAVGHG